jgi:hypothetical protein
VADELAAVSCPAPGVCEAVGYYMTSDHGSSATAERLSGGRWLTKVTPTPAGTVASSMLGVVACNAASACTSVGYSQTPSEVLSLADRFSP